jgi:hypothetical protein
MRAILTLAPLAFCAFTLQSAQIWTGQLFDAACVERRPELTRYDECTPNGKTAAFDLQVSGKLLKLDANGDRKAAEAWNDYLNSADRPIDPDFKNKPLTAVIQGTLDGDVLKVDSILLR